MSDIGNAIIKVNTEQLLLFSEEMNKKVNTMKEKFDEMDKVVSSTSDYWQGEAADKYRKDYKDAKSDDEEAFKRLSSYVESLNRIAAEYMGISPTIEPVINALPDDVIV